MKRRRLALLVTYSLVIFAAAVQAAAQQPIPTPPPTKLADYLAKNDAKHPATIQFVSLRCSSLCMFLAQTAKTQIPDTAARYEMRSKMFFDLAAQHSDQAQGNYVIDQLQRMTLMYTDRARAAKANTGNMFDDELLSSDKSFCDLLLNGR